MHAPRGSARTALAGFAVVVSAARVFAQAPAAQPPPPPPPAVKVGQMAPLFTLSHLAAKPDGGFERRQVNLADFRGKQHVVVAFFPAAFSPG